MLKSEYKLRMQIYQPVKDDFEFPDGSGVEPETESPPKKRTKRKSTDETVTTPKRTGRTRKRQLPEAVPESIPDSKKSK